MIDLTNIPFRQSPNYTPGRSGKAPDLIVIHSTEGSYDASVGWLLNPAAQASAHYIISEDGSQMTQLVKAVDTAWHAGNWDYNLRAIGIEHSWYSDMRNGAIPDGLLRKGAQLTAALCQKYNITPDRQHVIAHGEVPPPNDHTDPGPKFPWGTFMGYVQDALINKTANTQGGSTTMLINGFVVGHGFKDYFDANGGVKVFGLPLTNEETNPTTKLTEQTFERMTLEFDPTAAPDWQVRGKDIGRFYLANRGF